MPETRFIGKCIYCLAESGLSNEHIIPFSLNGNNVLHKACCDDCQKIINKTIEIPINNKFFKVVRSGLGLNSRNKSLFTTLPLRFADEEAREFPIADIGFPLQLPIIDTRKKEPYTGMYYTHIAPHDTNVPEGEYIFQTQLVVASFMRYLTKIAYGYTILSQGITQYNKEIAEYICSRNERYPNIVTRFYQDEESRDKTKVPSNMLHSVSFSRVEKFKKLVVKIELFCTVKAHDYPYYIVILDDKNSEK